MSCGAEGGGVVLTGIQPTVWKNILLYVIAHEPYCICAGTLCVYMSVNMPIYVSK